MATFDEFLKLDIRVGIVKDVRPLPEARRPAYQLRIDFGEEIGEKRSSAQITDLYTPEDLIGRAVVAVVNFPPKQIGRFISEVLVLGVPGPGGAVVLLQPDQPVTPGGRVY
jgi:tRNA-binding protein